MSDRSAPSEELSQHEAFESETDGHRLSTIVFDAWVSVETRAGGDQYTVRVRVPALDHATEDQVGPTVRKDWFETFERRLHDAPKATRATVSLDDLTVEDNGDTVTVRYLFTNRDPATAVGIAKTFGEFVEGTYVEGIVPGYEYEPPVTELLADASQGETSGTPL